MKKKHTKNKIYFKRAKKYLVGGVNSPVRSFNYVGTNPILIKKGKGARVYDYDGNEYIDYVLSYGALILGHAHPVVIKETKEAMANGFSFGTTNLAEIRLARLIQNAIPQLEKIRFVNSGTEAVMSAVRLARGYTGRDKIVKFTNAYHGHADCFLAKAGSGLATLQIPFSKGVPGDFIKHTIVVDYGNKAMIKEVFKKYGSEIAAVVVEPVGGNYGVVTPDETFLKYLRRITKQYKTFLIFDEIITGFRFSFGSAAKELGIEPDLICLGKIIGGGLPIGAYGAKEEIMNHLAPIGSVYQASTFAGNPVVMQAGIATLKTLAALKKKHAQLSQLAKELTQAFKKEAAICKVDLEVKQYETMFSLKFGKKSNFERFYKTMLEGGVYLVPSEYEANFISFAHSKKDIKDTISLARLALQNM